jgi:hypothetical protein
MKIPVPPRQVFVETEMVKEILYRTLVAHATRILCAWCGPSRVGKTTTAQHLVKFLHKKLEAGDQDAYRAIHYEIGQIRSGGGNESKLAIKSLYEKVLDIPMDPGVYWRKTSEALARMLVRELKARNIQMVLIDEIGYISIDAMRGMILVWDVAIEMDWPFSIIFIGMDDMAAKITGNNQMNGRFQEWCYFREYDVKVTWSILREVHPYFKKLDHLKTDDEGQVQFIHDICGGLPGFIIPFVHRLEAFQLKTSGKIDMEMLRTVHLMTQLDKKDAEKQQSANQTMNPHRRRSLPSSKTSGGKKNEGVKKDGKQPTPTATTGKP